MKENNQEKIFGYKEVELTSRIIKHECDTYIDLFKCYSNTSILTLGLLPYIALLSVESQNFFERLGLKIDIENKSGYDAKNARLAIKQFNERYGRARKKVIQIENLEDNKYRKKVRFQILQKRNIYYNLGLCFDGDDLIQNTHYIMSMFKGQELNGDNALAFGKELGQMLGSIEMLLFKYGKKPTNIKNSKFTWRKKDLNTNRLKIFDFGKKEDPKIQLLLMNTLTNLNFAYLEVEKVLGKNTLKIRIQFLVMYYAKQMIARVTEKIVSNEIKMHFLKCLDSIEPIFNVSFRNCMMHYSFVEKGFFLVKEEYFNTEKEFFGLVESLFDGKTCDELEVSIKHNMSIMKNTIESFMCINTKHLELLDA